MKLIGQTNQVFAAILCGVTACVILALSSPAHARTATYTSPSTLDNAELAALADDSDGAGVNIGLGQTLGLLFDDPFATTTSDDAVTVYTLRPSTGRSRGIVRIGIYNNGNPIFVFSRNIVSGRNISVGNLFNRGCSAFGGCDYIEILTTRTRRGASGVVVDYIDVNGEITVVAAPTPEPSAWAFMIFGFWIVAWRLKQQRRARSNTSPAGLTVAAA